MSLGRSLKTLEAELKQVSAKNQSLRRAHDRAWKLVPKLVRRDRQELRRWHDDMVKSWAEELAWAKAHPGVKHACLDAGRKLWAEGIIASTNWLLTNPEGRVPQSIKCERHGCLCGTFKDLAPGEHCSRCLETNRRWNVSADYNNDVYLPLSETVKRLRAHMKKRSR